MIPMGFPPLNSNTPPKREAGASPMSSSSPPYRHGQHLLTSFAQVFALPYRYHTIPYHTGAALTGG